MRQLTIAAVLPLVLGFACSSTVAQSDVVAAERARADAIARRDTAAYRRLASSDLLVIDRDGELTTIGDRLVAIEAGEATHARRVEHDVETRMYGDLAVIVGRSDWQDEGVLTRDYFTRIWANRNGALQLVGAHYTPISDDVVAADSSFGMPDQVATTLPIATTPPGPRAMEEVQRAIREQHEAYWSKDSDRYLRFAGSDLLRVAENGVRSREELVAGMRGNARLPAPPSAQLDVRVRLFGTTAVATWLDRGTDLLGRLSQNRFTVVFARRGDGWQMVHIHSTAVRRR